MAKNIDLDKAQVLGSELNNNGYHLLNVNRPTNTQARGGGIAPVLNVSIKLLKIEQILNFKSSKQQNRLLLWKTNVYC